MTTTRACGVALATILLTAAAAAQDVPNLRGRVITPAGAALPDVEVGIEGAKATARTDMKGAFVFVNVKKGFQNLQFRRIGYLPATISVKVPEMSDTLSVMLVPIPPTLDTVQVKAKLNVVAGIVLDAQNRPVVGAMVDMIGAKSDHMLSDEGGWFTFTSVRSGVVVVRARKEGYEMATHSMPLEDWRGIVLHLDTIDAKPHSAKRADLSGIGNAVEFAWKETQQRLTMRGPRAIIVTREDLAPFADMNLGEAVRHTEPGASLSQDLGYAATNVCVIEDGKKLIGSTSLDMYNADDVDWVEIYPPGEEPSGSLARYARGGGCRAVRSASGRGRGVLYAVVWLR